MYHFLMADDDPDAIDFGDPSDESSWNRRRSAPPAHQFAPPVEPCECYCLHLTAFAIGDRDVVSARHRRQTRV